MTATSLERLVAAATDLDPERRLLVADLVEQLRALGADELRVLAEVAAGLVAGRRVYGELRVDEDARDFDAEAGCEVRDSLVYLGAEAVRLHRRRSRR